jgi:hypothetical protein
MALWKVGRRSFLVEHRLASGERWLTDTDQAMTGHVPLLSDGTGTARTGTARSAVSEPVP